MSSKKFTILFVSIFLLGALPLLLLQPSGTAGAGLSAGFSGPFSEMRHLILLIGIGIWASLLQQEAMVMLPVCYILMVMIGAAQEFDIYLYPGLRMFVLGAILLFALAVSQVQQRGFLVAVLIASSIGFHLGSSYLKLLPDIASPLYFMIGLICGMVLILGIGLSFGLTITGLANKWFEKLRNLPAVTQFLSFF